jgi:hypothetical protein
MEKNMGQTDRIARAFIGVVMLVYAIVFLNFAGLVGLIFVATAAIGYCPLYTVLGISTNRYAE